MAESTPSNDTTALSHSSCFKPTVSLSRWWLIQAKNDVNGKRLAVSGISSRNEEARRVFVSAPIIKRYDPFSLETSDGIFVILNGFIDEERMGQNGFAPEVFNWFLFGFPPDWESLALDGFREESTAGVDLGNVANEVSVDCSEILSDGVENSIPTSLASPEKVPGDHWKPFPEDECDALKETDGVNVSHASGGSRCSARLQNIKVCQQKKQLASGGAPKHPDKEQSSTAATLENCEVEGLKSPVTPIQSQSLEQVNTLPELVLKKSASRISQSQGLVIALSEKLPKKSASRTSRSQGKVNASSEQLIKKSSSRTSQSRGKVNASSEQLIKKSASRISRTLSTKTESCIKKKEVKVKTTPKKKLTESASPVKYSRGRDVGNLIKEGEQKITSVSPESLSLRKSRSGRLLLPPLEFWRNQRPVYNADREIKEIQDGASLVSPCRVSSPSLSRFSNQKRAA